MHDGLYPSHQKQRPAWVNLFLLPAFSLFFACSTPFPIEKSSVPGTASSSPPLAPAGPGNLDIQALQSLVAFQDRLYRVAGPLLVNNTALCKNSARNLLGFTAKNKYSYSTDFIEAAHASLGLDEALQVRDILAGSGAEKQKIQEGDILLAIENTTLPQGHNAESQAALLLAPLVKNRTSVTVRLVRRQTQLSLAIPLTRACAFSIRLGNTEQVNAYSDGQQIMVTRGMMRFAQTDSELAYVIAKEMAHNILAHARKQKMTATTSDIIDNLARIHPDMSAMAGMAGIKPMPPEMDAAADALALHLVARANYNIEQAPAFWQKLARQYPATTLNSYTAIHPGTAYRLAAMNQAIVDIKKKAK